MSEAKHTPLPWEEVPMNRFITQVRHGKTVIAEFHAKGFEAAPEWQGYPTKVEQMVNVALFLAAPDLLAACKELANEASGFSGIVDVMAVGVTNKRALQRKIDAARMVIAKAEGRS
jgi:hypothetical protein